MAKRDPEAREKQKRVQVEQGLRLRQARLTATPPMTTADEAAKFLNEVYSTYAKYEDGSRSFGKYALDFSRKLEVNYNWLVNNMGPMRGAAEKPETGLAESTQYVIRQPEPGPDFLRELFAALLKEGVPAQDAEEARDLATKLAKEARTPPNPATGASMAAEALIRVQTLLRQRKQ